MTNDEYRKRLNDVAFTAQMNQLYHQTLEWRYGMADKALKILVGVLAVVGAVLAWPGASPAWAWVGFIVALASAVAAVALNVIPVGDKEKSHGELFRLWSDLLKDAVQEEHKTCEKDGDKEAQKAHDDRLCELEGKMHTLHASETAAWAKLLERCQGDVIERLWGKGVRSHEQVEQERSRKESATSAC